ncbi:MAG: diaminopimelate decarboxylase [Deltaproteobacteria bacterium]|jgi:diaminopimelate decarboxylase|nr:diaminopimelate decarboxylase [Deltaproteobacteria bacterium]
MNTASFEYRDGALAAEGVCLRKLADELGTPLYVYSALAIRRNFLAYEAAFKDVPHLVCYSVKAASNLALLDIIKSLGGGADIVSGGELYRARKVGIEPSKIVFSGVGKTEKEMAEALKADVLMFNVESGPEAELLNKVAGQMGKKAPISFRVNPDVDPKTHPYIATGLKESKFGIPIDEARDLYRQAKNLSHLDPIGLDCHIGSQLTQISPFAAAAERLAALLGLLKQDGLKIRYLDLGGGLGINYHAQDVPTAADYARAVKDVLGGCLPELTLIMEPGRSVVGPAGLMLVRVLYNKITPHRHFVIIDGAMNDLIRPSLYGSYHEILPVIDHNRPKVKVNVVGPVCESGDFMAQDRELSEVKAGECLAVFGAGAYGFSMSSNYNSRPRPAEVLADGQSYRVIRARETLEDLLRGETV